MNKKDQLTPEEIKRVIHVLTPFTLGRRVDDRPKDEIPDWAWETVYLKDEFDFCEKCCIAKGWVTNVS